MHARIALGEAKVNATRAERKQIAAAISKRYRTTTAENGGSPHKGPPPRVNQYYCASSPQRGDNSSSLPTKGRGHFARCSLSEA